MLHTHTQLHSYETHFACLQSNKLIRFNRNLFSQITIFRQHYALHICFPRFKYPSHFPLRNCCSLSHWRCCFCYGFFCCCCCDNCSVSKSASKDKYTYKRAASSWSTPHYYSASQYAAVSWKLVCQRLSLIRRAPFLHSYKWVEICWQ